MKSILLITDSSTLREYLGKKLESYGIKVWVGSNGLDGMLKLRTNALTLDLVIVDYCISRMGGFEFLETKQKDPNTTSIPVIIIASKIDKNEILSFSKMNVKKICSKPIKIDSLFQAISETLKMNLTLDSTKCVIDTHVNEDIIFIEIAYGLNKEKIDLLGFKIRELQELYELKHPKVLVIMSNIEITRADAEKLESFLRVITEKAKIPPKAVKILTNSGFTGRYVSENEDFSKIEVCDSLEKAMDALTGMKVTDFITEGKSIVMKDFLVVKGVANEETLNMKFQEECIPEVSTQRDITVGIIDDDMVAQSIVSNAVSELNYTTKVYDNGRLFLEDIGCTEFDMIFLDLMMPEVDGFGVLKALKEKNINVPVVIMSALSRKETVVQALKYGVHSYIIKPITPSDIMRKAAEIVNPAI
jgi:CheY-like chemotaxis protein